MNVSELVQISRRYGSNPAYVLAGGGNTSMKDADSMYVKASGTRLSDIDEDGFVKIDRNRLAQIWVKEYSDDVDAREADVLADLMSARTEGQRRRPSVETLMHDLLPFRYVVHTHPAMVNGLTCSAEGEGAAQELFGVEAAWVPFVHPGYILGVTIRDIIDRYRETHGSVPAVLLMENHGVVVGGDTAEEIDRIYERLLSKITDRLRERPDMGRIESDTATVDAIRDALTDRSPGGAAATAFAANAMIAGFVANETAFAEMGEGSFTPDHIVYAGHRTPLIGRGDGVQAQLDLLRHGLAEFTEREGTRPKTIAVDGLGFFGIGEHETSARTAVDLLTDAAQIAVYARSFGGSSFMKPSDVDFIRNWEVERYRKAILTQG